MLGFLAPLISSGLLREVRAFLDRRTDLAAEKDRNAAEVAKSLIEAEISRRQAQKELGLASMRHPVWWVAWGLFVIPVGLYHATIFLASTFALDIVVQRVPPVQEAWATEIIGSIFLAQLGAGALGLVARRFLGGAK